MCAHSSTAPNNRWPTAVKKRGGEGRESSPPLSLTLDSGFCGSRDEDGSGRRDSQGSSSASSAPTGSAGRGCSGQHGGRGRISLDLSLSMPMYTQTRNQSY